MWTSFLWVASSPCVYYSTNSSHFNILHLLEEPEADRLQRLLWPLVEPVDRCAVHHCRELPAANPQFITHWRETQSHLQCTHTHTHTHTHTARSNRIECEVWYSSEIIVIFCFSVSTTRVTVSCGKYRQGTPALIITSSWSRGGNGKVWINYLQLHH